MRTTVTLDNDVQSLIRAAMKERGISFEEALNSGLRLGLTQPQTTRPHFTQTTYSLGAPQAFTWDKALAIADEIEDEELSRRVSQLAGTAGNSATDSPQTPITARHNP